MEQIGAAFAASRGLAPDDLVLQVTAAALIEAVGWASDRWQASEGKADLMALVDEATDALVEGVVGISQGPAGFVTPKPGSLAVGPTLRREWVGIDVIRRRDRRDHSIDLTSELTVLARDLPSQI